MIALLAALLLGVPASGARHAQKVARDPRTEGLGKSCKKNADCKHRSQRCIHQSDAQGKPLDKGFCVLPCASFETGTQKVTPGAPVDVSRKAKKPPPRCPARFECRSAGAGVPIDMCVKN
jgi:hypothetical protein